jgi:hypothetical protein
VQLGWAARCTSSHCTVQQRVSRNTIQQPHSATQVEQQHIVAASYTGSSRTAQHLFSSSTMQKQRNTSATTTAQYSFSCNTHQQQHSSSSSAIQVWLQHKSAAAQQQHNTGPLATQCITALACLAATQISSSTAAAHHRSTGDTVHHSACMFGCNTNQQQHSSSTSQVHWRHSASQRLQVRQPHSAEQHSSSATHVALRAVQAPKCCPCIAAC